MRGNYIPDAVVRGCGWNPMTGAWVMNGGKHVPFPTLRYWRGTAKRLIRIDLIDIGGVQTIHRFGHQSGPGKRSGGLSTAKIHDFSARVFSDRSRTSKNIKKNMKQVQTLKIQVRT